MDESYIRAVNKTNTITFDGKGLIPADSVLTVKCVYDTSKDAGEVHAGFDSTDEMCNVFFVGALGGSACVPHQSRSCLITAHGDARL